MIQSISNTRTGNRPRFKRDRSGRRKLIREGRDERGRFVDGCPPGPGRPRKPNRRHHMAEGSLYIHAMELEEVTRAWQSIVKRIGPVMSRKMLEELEAEHGPIRFRGFALAAIEEAERGKGKRQKSAGGIGGQNGTPNGR